MIDTIEAKEMAYNDVKDMLREIVWKIIKKFGGDFDELMSIANEGFVVAYDTYKEGCGTIFPTWVWVVVQNNIRRVCAPGKIDRMTINIGEKIDLNKHPSKRVFNIGVFVDDLSNDAKQVVGMIVDSPVELLDICDHMDGPECIRSGLYNQLRETGWTLARIIESFIELRKAVS